MRHNAAMPKHKKDSPKTAIVDGLEGDQARIEDAPGRTHDAPVKDLPEGVREGDVLREVDGKLEIDHAETKRRRDKAQTELDAVNTEQPAGELDL